MCRAKSSVRALSISCASGQGLRLQQHVRQMQFAQQLLQQEQQQQQQQYEEDQQPLSQDQDGRNIPV